jgi:hypothetical protein
MDSPIASGKLTPQIHELLATIRRQQRLMIEMQVNLEKLEHDLAIARELRAQRREQSEEAKCAVHSRQSTTVTKSN